MTDAPAPRPAQPPSPAEPRADQFRDYAHRGRRWVPWVVVLVLLLIASVAEFTLIRTLMQILLPLSGEEWYAVPNLVAAAVVVVSTAAMFTIGVSKAKFDDSQADGAVATRRTPWGVIAVVAAWAIFGLVLVVVRWLAAETVFAAEDLEVERLLAILMSGLYLATGIFAFVDGYLVAEPYAIRVQHARRHKEQFEVKARRLDAEIAQLMGQVRRHEEVGRSPGTDPEQIALDYATQRQSIQDLGEALRRFARLEIARRAGSEEAAEAAGEMSPPDTDVEDAETDGRTTAA